MRILVITNYYPPLALGGWEQLTRDVAARLARRGHEICVLTSNHRAAEVAGAEPGIHRLLHLESPDYVRYHPHYTLTYRWRERQNDHTLDRIVTDFAPGVIFVNGMWNLPHRVAQRAEQLRPGRVVYYVASHWPTEPDAHTAYWTAAARSWRRLPKQALGSLVNWLWLGQARRNQLDFPLVLCVSAFMQRCLVEEAGIPPQRTQVVYNGIELDAFAVRDAPAESSHLRLLYAGRLVPHKGVHTLIEGLHHLRRRHPDLPVQLSLFGDGAPDYRSRLERLVREFDLADQVQFQGFVPRRQMPDVLAQHDVLAFPSIWPEPLARIVQEAMACGLVVIGTATGGTPEILRDGENGLTFEAENAPMLAEKIVLAARDQALRRRLAQAARQTVEERFSLERMVDQIERHLAQQAGIPL